LTLSRWEQVYAIVRQVPRGRVITYGTIARLLGDPRLAREVGWAMAATPREAPPIPAHRVIKADGELSGGHAFGGYHIQRKLLESEGIVFTPDGRVDLDRYLWLPRDASTRKQSRNRNQHDGAEHRNEQGLDVEATDHVAAKHGRGNPATDDRAQNPEHDVADDAVAAATHDQAS
jgi:methylated-DNA-protein-cysteine methyltransferase-like protein